MPSLLSRRSLLKAACLGLCVSGICPSVSGEGRKRPNIVLILADDVSPDLYGCYGNTENKTPNVDGMAREGVMFRTCWASSICAPSRALIMTGRYGSRTGFYDNGLQIPQRDGSNDLLKYHHSFGKMLKQAGYATAIAGKWHCSSSRPESDDGGFDEYCLWEGLKDIAKLPGSPEYTGGYEDQDTTSRYWHPGIIKNHKLLETEATDFGPDIFADFICDFIERKKDGPFLAYYPMVGPHGSRQGHTTTPLRGEVGQMSKQSREEETAKFNALNEYIDVLIGRIRKRVEDLGLLEDTVFIFCSDNGTAVTAKSRGVERGCRVLFVVSGAGVKRRGPTDELTDFSDVWPTLLDLAGVKVPDGYEIDGKSLVPFLYGDSDTHRDWIYSCIGTTQLVRTRRYLLEVVNPILGMADGRLYDCGTSRDGRGYKNISNSPEASGIRKKFDQVLEKYPALREDHPYFQTDRGASILKAQSTLEYREKHLHNHADYRFYEE